MESSTYSSQLTTWTITQLQATAVVQNLFSDKCWFTKLGSPSHLYTVEAEVDTAGEDVVPSVPHHVLQLGGQALQWSHEDGHLGTTRVSLTQ